MKVAFVIHRYGEGFAGGSEYLARLYAEQMKTDWQITVLTTCAKDYKTWANYFPEGPCRINGVDVLRFPVEKERNFDDFAKTSYEREKSSFAIGPADEAAYFEDQGPYSPELVDHISRSYDEFDVFIFFTYLYYSTAAGIMSVADKAYLCPTAHDEPPFYFARVFQPIFTSIRGIIYLSGDELSIIDRVYDIPSHVKKIPGMVGIPEPTHINEEDVRQLEKKYEDFLDLPFFIYLGRASLTKNCPELVHAFHRIMNDRKERVRLIFAGSIDFDWEKHPNIISLGFVSEKEKTFLLQKAVALINPSKQESLSLVLLEAWAHKTPVLVNEASGVMRDLCKLSRGGLYYGSSSTLQALMHWCLHDTYTAAGLGIQGYRFVNEHYHTDAFKPGLLREIN